MAPKNGPPDRWMDYSPMGDRISGTRFICMKVPLKQGLSKNIGENDKFSCENAIEMASRKGHKLGLVIDLSFTSRYYDPRSFEENNVTHKKIFMPGRILPKKEIINSFSDSVAKFEDDNEDNDDVIAVHCTHGLNRTGYMICRYLIDKRGFKPEDAIKAFEEARGHKIEREIYLNDLAGKPKDADPEQTPKQHSEQRNFSQDNYFDRRPVWDPIYDTYQDSKHWSDPYHYGQANSSQYGNGRFGGYGTGYPQENGYAHDSFGGRSSQYHWNGYASQYYDPHYPPYTNFTPHYDRDRDFDSSVKNGELDYSRYPSHSEYRETRPGNRGRGERYRIHDDSPYRLRYSNSPQGKHFQRKKYSQQY